MTTGGFIESVAWIGGVIFIGEMYSQNKAWAKALVGVVAVVAFVVIMFTGHQGP